MKVISAVRKYLNESYSELKKVTWPTKKETINNTILVIIVSIIVTAFLGGMDYIFGLGVEQIIK